MNIVRWRAVAVMFLLAVVSAQPASAIPVPTGPPDLIINFDLTSQTPAPPYDFVGISAFFLLHNPPGDFVVDFFGDLNGTGGLLSSFHLGTSSAFLFSESLPQVTDGVFSLGFHLNSGLADFETAFAQGFKAGLSTPPVPGSVAPEPATLALLGIGLAGLGLSRRRRKLN